MKNYIGTKLIKAEPLDKDGLQGYKVVYSQPNGSEYTSWSPKDVFEEAYREVNGMSFGLAIEALKKGYKVARAGWNGKCMHLYLEDMFHLTCPGNLPDRKYDPVIVMYTAQQTHQPGWLASQADILADDWQIIK